MPGAAYLTGMEWIVDAHGCDPARLKSEAALSTLFQRIVRELELRPVDEIRFHCFPEPGGVTGMLLLSESHLTVHTFPETGYCALNLYCCKPRPAWPWDDRLAELLGATRVDTQAVKRPAAPAIGGSKRS